MRKIKFIIIIFIALISVGITLFFSKEENQKKISNYISSFDKSEKEFLIEKSYEKDGLKYLNGRFVEWDNEKLTLSDGNKKVLWSKTFLLDNPKMVLNENRIVIYDDQTGVLYAYNGNGETLLDHDFDKAIFNLKVSDQGMIAHFKRQDSEEIIYYNFANDNWDQVSFIDSYPLNYWIDSSNKLMYTQMKIGENHITSELYRKTLDNKELQFDLRGRLILKVFYFKEGYLVLTDMGIVKINKEGDDIIRDFDLVHDILIDGEEIYILYGDNLEVLNTSLETVHKKTYVLSFTRLHKHEKYILLSGEKNILALSNKEDKADHSFGSGILDIKSQFNDLIVTLKTGVYTMRIRDIQVKDLEE